MKGPILVTGAGGFIGRQVVRQLAERGRELRLLDRRLEPAWAVYGELLEGSVADHNLVAQAMHGVSAVVHLAHLMDIEGDTPFDSAEVNIAGTANVFRAALDARVRRVVWASSVMTYDRGADGLPADEDAIQAPRTLYGAGKLYLEHLGRSCRRLGLETVALRFTTVFGPDRDRGGAAPFVVDLFRKPVAGLPVAVEDGDRQLDMLYLPDAVGAIDLALAADGALQAAYNIGGFSARVRDLVDAVRRRLPDAQISVRPGGSNPWPESVDCSAARRDIGYAAKFTLEQTVADYLDVLSTRSAQ